MTGKERSSVILFTLIMSLFSLALIFFDSMPVRATTVPVVVWITGYFVSERLIKGEE